MPQSFTPWMQNNPYWSPTANTPQPEPIFRDPLDRARASYRRTPEAMYPDGYLGTIRTRREDKMAQYLAGTRRTQRNYQRGVHKGERIDPQDYLWPRAIISPEMGIQLEAQGRKFAPSGTTNEQLASKGKMPVPRGAHGILSISDPKRVDQLKRLAPSWNP